MANDYRNQINMLFEEWLIHNEIFYRPVNTKREELFFTYQLHTPFGFEPYILLQNSLHKFRNLFVDEIVSDCVDIGVQKMSTGNYWLVLSNASWKKIDSSHDVKWYWLPASKIIEYGARDNIDENTYIVIPQDKFTEVDITEPFENIEKKLKAELDRQSRKPVS